MSDELILTNARIVTADAVIPGSVVVRNGFIAVIAPGPSHAPGAVDCNGDYLLPGLVELHTDNLEKHAGPRPGVRWPMQAAVLAHDAQVAAAGITTVYDALTVGEMREDQVRAEILGEAVAAIREGQRAGVFRAEHFLHMRCEVGHEHIVELVSPFLDDPLVRLVSLMDHSPGQRQFVTVEKYNKYYQARFGYSDEEMRVMVEQRIANARRFADQNRAALAALCAERDLPRASHDDGEVAHIAEAAGFGVTIAEFPTTREAAEAAYRGGMAVVMGAPNLVRGGSHSGNISAAALAEFGVLDILSSDYVPFSLLHAAFLLHTKIGLPLPEAVAKVSLNPAQALGLGDRGEIAEGLRGDLVRVSVVGGMPVARQAWRLGERIV
jgi:alpha-D-ribose 1-methylphosphonate 5-triphosphate diphosphatase